MSWGPEIARAMKLRLRVAAIVVIGAMVVCGDAGMASTQDSPPDLRMLMNLDLFEPRHNQASASPAASPSDDSMLDQIRTLDQMGYLGQHRDNAAAAAESSDEPAPKAAPMPSPAEAPEPQTAPASAPSDDVEGPLP
jgi:hypothetical protein